MATILNEFNISLPLAILLAYDDYDYDPRPNYISATGLLKTTKQIVLNKRMQQDDYKIDITSFTKARLGQAIHALSETAWRSEQAVRKGLELCGYQPDMFYKVIINPPEGIVLEKDDIPVYIEQRAERKLGDWIIGGKFDLVIDGQLSDIKSTGTYTYVKDNNRDKYCKQGSIYKWLNPTKITNPILNIEFVFTDWMQGKVYENGYPEIPTKTISIPLMEEPETERFMKDKLKEVVRYMDSPQNDIPNCTDEELWMDKSQWQYFSKAENSRATKNFDTQGEAITFMESKGVGIIKEKKAMAKHCHYCNVRPICKQAEQLEFDKLL